MRVLLIGKSADNPSTRYRLEPVAARLRDKGHETRVYYEPDFLTQLRIVIEARSSYLVFIQRKLLSGLMVRMLRLRAGKLVFDFDDAVFLRSDGRVSESRSAKFDSTVVAADLVVAGNRYLADAATARGAKAEVIPTCVSTDRYHLSVEKLPTFTLVWIGSRSTSRYLELIREDLEEIGKTIPGLRLRIIADFELSVKNVEVECFPWSEQTEVEALMQCHVGIAPMKDDAWTRGKCALKVIQYMSAGLPVISSDVGANREVIEEGETGFLARDREDWLTAITRLSESESLRQDMGQKARAASKERFSLSDASSRLVQTLEDLAVNNQ